MKSKPTPTLVKLVKSYGNEYLIKFPKLKIEITVSKYYYNKISNSPNEYQFI